MPTPFDYGGYGSGSGGVGTLADSIGRLRNSVNGTAAANAFTAAESALAREFNSAEAAKNRSWEEYMSNTAYQRQVEDLKAAGLNPALALGSGSGASTPSGYSATANSAMSVGTGHSGSILGMVGSIAKTALSIALFKKFGHSAMSAKNASASVAATTRELKAAQAELARTNAYNQIAAQKAAHWKKLGIDLGE